jgi:hypothetical protein
MHKVAVLQSNYIPWKGYFDIIGQVDTFIFYDDLQFTKNDWRNRNKIKTQHGLKWLRRLICEVALEDSRWQQTHWNMIREAYRRAPFFDEYSDFFKPFYLDHTWTNLSELNQTFIKQISKELLGIDTRFEDSRSYQLEGVRADRLLNLLKQAGATHYLSGPAAKDYIDEQHFRDNGIEVLWMDYSDYPEYNQLYPPFEHAVSIIDLFFNVGKDAVRYMKFPNTR